MANIDVTNLMSDPDFVDKIQVLSRVAKVNNLGGNLVTESCLETVGSVQPATGRALSRLPEALRQENMSSFWYKGQIVASDPGKYPSILVFKGRRFQVKNVFDWSNFGQGYTEGLCVAEAPS